MTLSDFLHMGGYAAFVWPAYLITTVILIANFFLPVMRHRRLKKLLSLHTEPDQAPRG